MKKKVLKKSPREDYRAGSNWVDLVHDFLSSRIHESITIPDSLGTRCINPASLKQISCPFVSSLFDTAPPKSTFTQQGCAPWNHTLSDNVTEHMIGGRPRPRLRTRHYDGRSELAAHRRLLKRYQNSQDSKFSSQQSVPVMNTIRQKTNKFCIIAASLGVLEHGRVSHASTFIVDFPPCRLLAPDRASLSAWNSSPLDAPSGNLYVKKT